MKKLISVMLVLCMVLALVPAMAFAANGDGYVRIGETVYGSMKDAIAAAKPGDIIDVQGQFEGFTLSTGKSVTIKLNSVYNTLTGKIWVDKGASLTIIGPGVVENGVAWGDTTLYNLGTVNLVGGEYHAVFENYGTMTMGSENQYNTLTFEGAIINGGEDCKGTLTLNSGKYTARGTAAVDASGNSYGDCLVVNEAGTVTVNGGSYYGNYLFGNFDSVVLNGGYFAGTHLHLGDKIDKAPTINGGAFTDGEALNHRGSVPVAGFDESRGPEAWNDLTKYDEFWFGKATIESRAAAKALSNGGKGGDVIFMYGDVSVSVPGKDDGMLYYNAWDGHYNGYGAKDLDIGKLDGRGLVNGYSDVMVLAKKVDDIGYTSSLTAQSVLMKNQAAVKSVSAKWQKTNDNCVFVNIYIDVNVNALTEFAAEGYTGVGNYIGAHQFVPIAIGFCDLNHTGKAGQMTANKAWDTAFTNTEIKVKDPSTYKMVWIAVDHNDKGDNASFDYVDTKTDVVYRCTVVINNVENPTPNSPHPDDEPAATTHPADSATTKPAGTGTGEGDGPAKTGDNSTVMLWATLLVASAAGVAICVVDEAKKRSRK